jgi:sugar O-acyltransferase (sialic acid O-acetyltransferase NeuD family)
MKLTIIGASGHGRVIADIARLNGYNEIEFLDDNKKLKFCGKYPVVGTSEKVKDVQNDMIVGIGNAKIRQRVMERLSDKRLATLIHPNAVIAEDVVIGKGSVVMAGTVINPGAIIGNGCIVNTCSSIDHDCNVNDFVHVSVGAHLCGTVTVGESTWIGAGATISNNITICGNCMIGAGAVVVKNIEEEGTYVGVPARVIY